jgi:hypothetical protein
MELAFSRNGESCQLLRVLIQLHLPEARREIQCCQNGGISSPNGADAFGDLLHGVLVDVGVLVQFSEVLKNPESLALFLWNTENGWVIEWIWSLNDPQFQPFIQGLLDELMIRLWDFELLPVDGILCHEMNLVLEILGQAQIVFVNAESALVFAQNIQISFLELLWYLQVASSLDFFPG